MRSLTEAVKRRHTELAEPGRFEAHAAPEAIAEHLDDAVTALDRLQQHVRWLSALHGQRQTEKLLGLWPPGEWERMKSGD